MYIREMEITDYEAAMALWNGADGVGYSPDDTEASIAKYLNRNPGMSFVAIQDDVMIGAIMSGHDGYRGFIHHTAVLPSYQGKGVGKQLVQYALDAIRKDGVHKVVLVVFETNTHGNAFWENLGFTVREDLLYRNIRISNFD